MIFLLWLLNFVISGFGFLCLIASFVHFDSIEQISKKDRQNMFVLSLILITISILIFSVATRNT